MRLEKYKDSHGNYFEFSTINKSLSTIFIHGVGLDNTMWYPQKSYFQNKSVSVHFIHVVTGNVRYFYFQ